jgi:RNA polymerase sigma-70 factor, ECF subfamily
VTRSGDSGARKPGPGHRLGPATPERDAAQPFTGAGDAKLLVAIGHHSHQGLAEVYRRHAGAVYGLARRVVGNPSDAEDITQEVFVRLWNQPDRFDAARGSLRTFLLTQTHSRAVELVRSRAARALREEREARLAEVVGNDLDREISDLVVAQQVADAMTQLPEVERRALELAYYHGHTYREVASLLDQPEGTVKSRIRSGLSRLRRSMTENEVAGR